MTTAASGGLDLREGRRSGVLIGGWAGVMWAAFALLRVPLTGALDQPSWTASRLDIMSFYTGSRFDSAFVTGIGLAAVAYVLFVVFVAKVADLIRVTDRESRWLSYLILGGATVDTALVFAYLAPFAVAVFWAGHGGLSVDAYLVLHGLSFGFLWVELITITLWMTPLGVAILRTRLFPTWLGWAMLINVSLLLASFFLPYEVWTVTSGLPYLWILIGAVLMIIRSERYAPVTSSQ